MHRKSIAKTIVITIMCLISQCYADITWRDIVVEWLKTDSYADVNYDGIVNFEDYFEVVDMSKNYYAWGDSITNRVGASDDAHSYVNLVAAEYGWTLFENGSNGYQTKDKAVDSIAHVTTANDIHTILLGYNDMRFWDTDKQMAEMKANLAGQIAHLAIPDLEKIIANDTGLVTEVGTWNIPSSTIRLRATGKYGGSLDATASFSFTGDTLLVWVNKYSNALGGIENDFEISVDGRPVEYHTPFGSEITNGDIGAGKGLALVVVSDLSSGTHTAQLKRTDSHICGWEFATGLDSSVLRTDMKVYVGNVMRTDATGYANSDVLPAVGSDVQVSKYNDMIRETCSFLASLGLWVAYVDILDGFIPIDDTTDPTNGMLETPLSHLHPNDKGHQHIADKFIESINKGVSGVRLEPKALTRIGSTRYGLR